MSERKRTHQPDNADSDTTLPNTEPTSKRPKLDAKENPFKIIPKGPKADTSLGVLKKKIRDAERSLNRPKLHADVKIDLQRRLKALNFELEKKKMGEVEQKLYEKYKYIKHVERTKIQRKIKKLQKQAAEGDGDEEEELEQKVLLAYVDHFPRDMKYISLFPKSDGGDDETKQDTESKETDALRLKIKKRIRLAVESGEVERDGFALRSVDVIGETKKPIAAPVSGGKQKEKSKQKNKGDLKADDDEGGDKDIPDGEMSEGKDDFFLSGDGDEDDADDSAPIEQYVPDYTPKRTKQSDGRAPFRGGRGGRGGRGAGGRGGRGGGGSRGKMHRK
ncbi:18S rRNA maturation protein [Dinochytrium kinnereticum]|nr:18S rRNA maturation protein [Dinochytrium kinnereticum]